MRNDGALTSPAGVKDIGGTTETESQFTLLTVQGSDENVMAIRPQANNLTTNELR